VSSVAAYHCKCIDTWLVEDSDLCPLCKKSVIDDGGEDEEDMAGASASASQSAAAAAASNVNDAREDAPLLQHTSRHRPWRHAARVHGSLYCHTTATAAVLACRMLANKLMNGKQRAT